MKEMRNNLKKKKQVFLTTKLIIIACLAILSGCNKPNNYTVVSPNGKLKVKINLDSIKTPVYTIYLNEKQVVGTSQLGIALEETDQSFLENLKITGSATNTIKDDYISVSGKRRQCSYRANELSLTFSNQSDKELNIIFQVSDNSAAFRYKLNNLTACKVEKEVSEFNLDKNSIAFIQSYKPVWNDYEKYYEKRLVDTMQLSAYYIPGLFQTPDSQWIFISDAAVNGDYAACQLAHDGEGKLSIRFPDQFDEWEEGKDVPWYQKVMSESADIIAPSQLLTPWRAIIISDNLGDIVESDLIKHLSPPSKISDESWIKPGVVTFPWWGNSLANDKPEILKEYIDFAKEMNWDYIEFDIGLVNNGGGYAAQYWRNIDFIPEVINYAISKGIKVYGWDERSNLDTPEKRADIFGKYKEWGVSGIKMDFINSDKQEAMQWYDEATAHAAEYGLLVSFHGAITPRGLQRTYPNIMTFESVKGAEYYKFEWHKDLATPKHNCTLPFTRNVSGPMDYTPVSISTNRRTSTYAQEIALPFIFESGWVCMADKPEVFRNSPAKELLQNLHAAWDDFKFINGYPGEYCCLARKKGDEWFVAAINTEQKRNVEIDFSFLTKNAYSAKLYTGNGNDWMKIEEMNIKKESEISFELLQNSGFVIHLKAL